MVMVGAFLIQLSACVKTGDQSQSLIDLGAIVPETLPQMELWRLLAALFLHAGILHLIFNLWAFVQLGYAWEVLFGAPSFLVTFFVTGLIASLFSAATVKPPGSVGASGAIFGLLSALIVILTRAPAWRTAQWTRRLASQLSIWAAITIAAGFLSPRIDNAAHIGGLLAGVAVGAVLPTTRVGIRDTSPKENA